MKILIPVLTGLTVLCASWCAPAFATQTSQGSRVLVLPLLSKGVAKSNQPILVLRLPTQAGKVSKMVTTNLVAKGPSWIAKGNNYYSLCVPNRRMVACAPIVATSVMQDIEVGAMAGPKGEPLLTFKISLSTKQAPKRIGYAINDFLTRTNKQVAHFNRKAVSYAPVPWQTSLKVGPTSNSIDDTGGSGGSCTYDDEGGMDCSGGGGVGGGGNEGGGYGGNENDYDPIPGTASTPNESTGQCAGDCNYPSGNNNGDPDPCIDPDGNRICSDPSQIPPVHIIGQVPPAPACDTQPDGSIVCGMQAAGTIPGMPPVWIPIHPSYHLMCS
ncbi:hypothetical protein [Massilia sp. TWR1-2-2]|uniref:hypothetical protein n=1 Tax=Massilia sp. TWR1-2-2 TaxID=2804584 RepID=UPI003CE925A1